MLKRIFQINIWFLFFLICFSHRYIYDYADLEYDLEMNHGNIKIEAFKLYSNDEIIEKLLENKYNRLSWVSIGQPTLLSNHSYFSFNNEGFNIKIELINNFIKNQLIKEIKNKYSIDVSKSQIKNIGLDILECKLKYIDKENKANYLFGKAKDLKSYPIRVEFNLPFELKKRKAIEMIIRNSFEIKLDCDFRSDSVLNQENILYIEGIEFLDNIFKLNDLLCLSEYQMNNLYSILYSYFNILENFNLDLDSFKFKIEKEFIKKASDSFSIKPKSFSSYLRKNNLSDLEKDFENIFLLGANRNIFLNTDSNKILKLKLNDKNELFDFNFDINKYGYKNLLELNNFSDIEWSIDNKANKIIPNSIKCVCLSRNKFKKGIRIDTIKSVSYDSKYKRKIYFEIHMLNNRNQHISNMKIANKKYHLFTKFASKLVQINSKFSNVCYKNNSILCKTDESIFENSKLNEIEKTGLNNLNSIKNLSIELNDLRSRFDKKVNDRFKQDFKKADLNKKSNVEDISKKNDTIKISNNHLKVTTPQKEFLSIGRNDNSISCFTILKNGNLATGSWHEEIKIWSLEEGSVIQKFNNDSFNTLLILKLPDENLAIINSQKHENIKIIEPFSGNLIKNITLNNITLFTITVLRNGYLAVGTEIGNIIILNPNNSQIVTTLKEHSNSIEILECLKDGNLLSGSSDQTLKMWDKNNWKLINSIAIQNKMPQCLIELNNKDYAMACMEYDFEIIILNINNSIDTSKLIGHSEKIISLVVLKNGYLASGSLDKTIKIWNPYNANLITNLQAHTAIYALSVLENGNLISLLEDHTIKIWNLYNNSLVKTINEKMYPINSLSVLTNGNLIGSSIKINDSLKIWNPNNGKLITTINYNRNMSIQFSILNNGNVIICFEDEQVQIWNPYNSRLIKKIQAFENCFKILLVLKNGNLACASNTIKIYNITSEKTIFVINATNSYGFFSLIELYNGLLAVGTKNEINIWNQSDGTLIKSLNTYNIVVLSLVVLKNDLLVSIGHDSSLSIWNTTEGKLIRSFKTTNTNFFSKVKYSMVRLENGFIATSVDDKIQIWDPQSGNLVKSLTGHRNNILSLVVLQNGYLASSSEDCTIKIWN